MNKYGLDLQFLGLAGVTDLLCPPPQECSTTSLNVTCKIEHYGLVWKVWKLEHFDFTELFTAADPAGTIETEGPFTAVLNQTNPALSSLFITPDPSMNGINVDCIDGLNGGKKSCELSVISKKKMEC